MLLQMTMVRFLCELEKVIDFYCLTKADKGGRKGEGSTWKAEK